MTLHRTKDRMMTASEANKKIRALVAQGENKRAGQIWYDYIYGETWEIEMQRPTRSIELRHAKMRRLGIFADTESRYHGNIEIH